ncbi:MAG: hypothetical protein JSW67_13810 [Candidatus Latescibacterota bacterium]|nr:MAG: hypothetical protein JSW67_13810 [Candidatus Latescibacterota bacterium]
MRARARRTIRRRTRRSWIWAYRHTLRSSSRERKLWLAVVIVRAMLLVPSALANEATTQRLTLDEVQIEGKLYSPQALFVVSRAHEEFGRDAVVPHYLQLGPSTRLLPYRLREALLERTAQEKGASAEGAIPSASASDASEAVQRRSP